MAQIHIYILDDSAPFVQRFKNWLDNYLSAASPFSYTLSAFTNAAELLAAANADHIELLIEDIELGTSRYTGIDAVNDLRKIHPKCNVIYLSAYTSYALDVFDTKPLYFISKNEYQTRLPNAMELFWHTYSEQCQYIRLTINNKPITIYLNNLIYCEHSNRVTRLVLSNGELLSYTSLRNIYELLPQNRFALCHKSYIVNFNYVLTYSRHIVTLTNCAELPMSRSFCDAFRARYRKWLSNYASIG